VRLLTTGRVVREVQQHLLYIYIYIYIYI
jgi:hypothetical protein